MKIGIQRIGKSIAVVKDYEDADLAEIGLFLTELEVVKHELLELFNEKKNV